MTDASRLDRLITYLSPARGAKRLAARRAIEALSYEGARTGPRESGWVTGSTSANAEIAGDRIALRNRVRSLLRDNAYAVKGLETLVVNRIGTGILASADTGNMRTNARVQDLFKRWGDRCDYAGRTDFYGIQALAERCRVESGEAFIKLIPFGDVEDETPLRLQVLEPDYIDTDRVGGRRGGPGVGIGGAGADRRGPGSTVAALEGGGSARPAPPGGFSPVWGFGPGCGPRQ